MDILSSLLSDALLLFWDGALFVWKRVCAHERTCLHNITLLYEWTVI